MRKRVLLSLLFTLAISLGLAANSMLVMAESYVDAVNSYFTQNEFTGVWEQSAEDTAEGSMLKVKTPAANIGNGAIISTGFGGLAAADYTLTFDMKIPQAGDQGAGYFYSCGNPVTHPGIGLNFVTFRNAITVTKLMGESSPWNVGNYLDGKAPAEGDWIQVSISVADGTMRVNAKNAGGEAIVAEIVIENVVYDESFTQGFVVNDCANPANTGFKNVVYQAGGKTFTAYPFDPDFTGGTGEATYTSILDNNILTMTGFGAWEQKSDGSELKALVGNPSLGNRAVVFSSFGGEYTENFSLSFETTVPEDATDTDNGMYFRAPNLVEGFYSGVLVRIKNKSVQIVYSTEPDDSGNTLKIEERSFTEGAATTGAFVKVLVTSAGTKVTADVVALGSDKSILSGEALEVTTTCPYTVDGKETFAGFYSDKAFPAKFKNIVMTGDGAAENFTAYPFGKTVTDSYKITAPEAVDLTNTQSRPDGVALSEENKANLNTDMNVGYNDVELIGQFARIFYFHYDGKEKAVDVKKADGGELPEGYSLKIYNGAYLTLFTSRKNAGRDGLKIVVYDETGYVVFVEDFVIHTIKKDATLAGVTAVDREYDGTRAVDLTGGTLSGILEGDEVSFDLGKGTMETSGIGTAKPVTTGIALTGAQKDNYYLVQPEGLTVDIAKGTQQAPYAPELESKTQTSVVLIADSAMEYSLDGQNWQTSNVFENLSPSTEYTFYCRIKADENQNASPASEGLTVKTEGKESGGGCNSSAQAGILATLVLAAVLTVFKKR